MFLNFKKVKVIVILFVFNSVYSGDFKQVEFNGYEFDLESQKLLEDFSQAIYLANYPCTHHCDEYKEEMFQKLYDGLARNYTPAINFLGVLSENGWHAESCLDCAYNYFSIAAMHGDRNAKQNLRRFQQQYFPDLSLAQVRKIFKEKSREFIRSDEGKEYIKKLVKQANKDINAAYQLGNYFSLDENTILELGIKENQIIKALKYAADNGHMHAKYLLGKYLYSQQKFKEAFSYFNSITPGNFLYSRALNILGWMHYNGQGVEANLNKSLSFFLRSVAEGYQKAQFGVGLASIYRGNVDTGINYLQLAAQRGNGAAFRALGDVYKSRNELDKCFEAYKSAADLGDTSAALEVACCYYAGIGIEPNAEQALKYFETAEKSNEIAAFNAELTRVTLKVKKTLKDLVNITKEIDKKGQSNINVYLLVNLDACLKNDLLEIPEEDYVEAFLFVIQKVNFEENKDLIKCIFKSLLAKLSENNLKKVVNVLNQKNFFRELNLEDYSLEEVKKLSNFKFDLSLSVARHLFEKGDFSFAVSLFEDAVQKNDLDRAVDIFVKSKFNMVEIKLITSTDLQELTKSNDQRASYLYAIYLMQNAEKEKNEWFAVDACQILNRLSRQNYRNSFELVVHLSNKFKDLISNEELLDIANFVLTQDSQKEQHVLAQKVVVKLNKPKTKKENAVEVKEVVKVEKDIKAEEVKQKEEDLTTKARKLYELKKYKEAYAAFRESVQSGNLCDIWDLLIINRLENLNELSPEQIELYFLRALNGEDDDFEKAIIRWKRLGVYEKIERLAQQNDEFSNLLLSLMRLRERASEVSMLLEGPLKNGSIVAMYIYLKSLDSDVFIKEDLIDQVLNRCISVVNQDIEFLPYCREILLQLAPRIESPRKRFEISRILMRNKATQEDGIGIYGSLFEPGNLIIAQETGAYNELHSLAEQNNKSAMIVCGDSIIKNTFNKIKILFDEKASDEEKAKLLVQIDKEDIIKNYKEGLSWLRKAEKIKTNSLIKFSKDYLSRSSYGLGIFCYFIDRYEEANQYLEYAYNNAPSMDTKEIVKPKLANTKYKLAYELVNNSDKQQDLEKAVALFKKSGELGYIPAYKSLGALLLEMHLDSNIIKKGKKLLLVDAEAYLNRALEQDPDDDTIRMDLAIVAYLNNDEAKGLKVLREARSPLRMISNHLLNLGDRIFNGLSDVDRLLTLKGKDAFTFGLVCIRCAADLGNTKAQMVVGKIYYQTRNFYRIGYESEKDWKLAEKYLKMAIEIEYDGIEEEYCLLANIYANTNREKEAIELYCRAEKRGYAKASQEKGVLYHSLRQYKQAFESFENSLKLNPNLSDSHNCIALSYLNGLGTEKNVKKAVSHIIKAIQNSNIVDGKINCEITETTLKIINKYLMQNKEEQLLDILNKFLSGRGYKK